MSDKKFDRRSVLRTSGTTLAALTGVSLAGNTTACIGCGDGGDDGGGSDGSPPSVTTKGADVNDDQASLTGSLDSVGDDDSADAWLEWGPEGDGLPYDTDIAIMYDPGWYTKDTYDGLSSGTYEYRAAASNDWGKDEGSILTFTI